MYIKGASGIWELNRRTFFFNFFVCVMYADA